MSTGSTSLINRSWITRFIQAYLLAFIGLSAVYFPTLIHTFGHSDDYIFFSLFRSGAWHPLVNEITAMGRPLNSLLLWLFLGHGNDLHTLTVLRGFGIATQAFFAATVFTHLRTLGYKTDTSVAAAALFIFTPAMAVYAGWAIVSHYALGAAMAFLGGSLVLPMITGQKARGFSSAVLIGALMMLASVALYQPTFYTACLPLLFWYVRERLQYQNITFAQFSSIALKFILFTSGLLILYFLIFRIYSATINYDDPAVHRSNLNLGRLLDLPFEMVHLWLHVGKSWGVFFHWIIQALFLAFVVGPLLILAKWRGVLVSLQSTAVLLVFFTWSTMPFYLFETSTFPFRVLAVQYILFSLPIVALMLIQQHEQVLRAGAVTLAVSLGCISGWSSFNGIMLPNINEVNRYREVLHQRFQNFPDTVLFRFSFGLDPNVLITQHEFGLHSMWLDWVPQPLIQILLNEQFERPVMPRTVQELETVSVITIYPWQRVSTRGKPLLDDYEIRFGLPAPAAETYDLSFWSALGRSTIYVDGVGVVEELNNGWIYCPKTGFIRIHAQ